VTTRFFDERCADGCFGSDGAGAGASDMTTRFLLWGKVKRKTKRTAAKRRSRKTRKRRVDGKVGGVFSVV
jgi:hypothetical protein